MNKLNELKTIAGARSDRKRVGRGYGSGTGKTSGYGHKGQKARSGVPLGMTGGQTPLFRLLPKRGFTARPNYTEHVTLLSIARAISSGYIKEEINVMTLKQAGLIRNITEICRIIGDHDLAELKGVKVSGLYLSKKAREIVEKHGSISES